MASKIGTFSFAAVVMTASAAAASGPQDGGDSERSLAPIDDAIELTLGMGYSQGFGDAPTEGRVQPDLKAPGYALETGMGFRIIPQLTLGMEAAVAMYDEDDLLADGYYGASAGLRADWHFLPSGHSLDPYVSLGSGWHGYWIERDVGTTSLQGIDFAKLELGVDYRAERFASIGPVIGCDLTSFLWESAPRDDGDFVEITDRGINTFVFVGVTGRIDIATHGDRSTTQVASR